MVESILTSIKVLLGITEDCIDFDPVLIIHINSVFMILNQMGVGPSDGYKIDDKNNSWDEYVDPNDDLESVKTYVYLKVKMLFDPPLSSSVMSAINQQISELEWRLNVGSNQ